MSDQPDLRGTTLALMLDKYGTSIRPTLTKISDLVDAYEAIPFNTRKATQEDIVASYNALTAIYNATLGAPREHCVAAIRYTVACVEQGRQTTFSPIRMNMMPNIEKGGSKSGAKFVGDLNQLFGNLARVRNATELQKIMRLEPVYRNIRSASHREAVQLYIASIDH